MDRAERDPLAGGGWNGLTLLGLGALTIAVTLTLAIHALVAVRSSRVELTVIRALGFSHRQLVGLLILERVLVAALGLASGAAIGYFLGRWTLGLMGFTPGGLPIIPPMVINGADLVNRPGGLQPDNCGGPGHGGGCHGGGQTEAL